MNKSTVYTIGILLILITVGGLLWWISTANSTESDIEDATTKIEKVDSDILQNETVETILEKQISEGVPVEPQDYNNENIF